MGFISWILPASQEGVLQRGIEFHFESIGNFIVAAVGTRMLPVVEQCGRFAVWSEMAYWQRMENNTSEQTNEGNAAAPVATGAPAASEIATQKQKHTFSLAAPAEKSAEIVGWLEDNHARDVVALDVAANSQCMDVIIVLSANSQRHARSLADGLLEQCKLRNYEFLHMEGYQNGQWILLDLNDIVVHIFQPEIRDMFRIESLWKQAVILHRALANNSAGAD